MHSMYKYRVPYKRTQHWWNKDWADISEWCNKTFGAGNWDYYYDGFVFEHERDYMLFKMKWGVNA